VTALEASQAANNAFAATKRSIENTARDPQRRSDKLKKLVVEIPARVRGIAMELLTIKTFAFDEERDDVENDVREQIELFEKSFISFETHEVNIGRPRYLDLEERVEVHGDSLGRIVSLAHAQHDEMVRMRGQVVDLQSSNSTAVANLRTFISSGSNSGDVDYDLKQSVAGFRLGSYSNDGSRQQLRDTVGDLEAEAAAIREMDRSAREAVRIAEAAREAERERQRQLDRERQAEQAREQERIHAAAAAASYTPPVDFGGSNAGTTDTINF
jgi:hypothetical protein